MMGRLVQVWALGWKYICLAFKILLSQVMRSGGFFWCFKAALNTKVALTEVTFYVCEGLSSRL